MFSTFFQYWFPWEGLRWTAPSTSPRYSRWTSATTPPTAPPGPLAGKDSGHQVGDVVNFWAIDQSGDIPVFYLTSATCRHSGELTYIFVEDTQWGVNFYQEGVETLSSAWRGKRAS